MKAYTDQRSMPDFGHRIFLPYIHCYISVCDRLKFLSNGGCRFDNGICKGWDFNEDKFQEALHYLAGYGFTLEEFSL